MIDRRLNDKGKNWRHVFKVCNRVIIMRAKTYINMHVSLGSLAFGLLYSCRLRKCCAVRQGECIRCQDA